MLSRVMLIEAIGAKGKDVRDYVRKLTLIADTEAEQQKLARLAEAIEGGLDIIIQGDGAA